MKTKILTIIFLLIFVSFVSADSLAQVKIRSIVPLHENLTIAGNYINVDGNAGILCSFKIFDVQTSEKYLIERLSDEYTFSDGSFSSTLKITEPLFQRGYDYNAVVCCNTACFDQNFSVVQKADIILGKTSESLSYDLVFWNNPDVFMIIVYLILLGLIIYFALIRR